MINYYVVNRRKEEIFDIVRDIRQRINKVSQEDILERIKSFILYEYDYRHLLKINLEQSIIESAAKYNLFIPSYMEHFSRLFMDRKEEAIKHVIDYNFYGNDDKYSAFIRIWEIDEKMIFVVETDKRCIQMEIQKTAEFQPTNENDLIWDKLHVLEEKTKEGDLSFHYEFTNEISTDMIVNLDPEMNRCERVERIIREYDIWSKYSSKLLKEKKDTSDTSKINDETYYKIHDLIMKDMDDVSWVDVMYEDIDEYEKSLEAESEETIKKIKKSKPNALKTASVLIATRKQCH